MIEHPQFEYYTNRKLDIAGSEVDRKLVEEFWEKKVDDTLEVLHDGGSQKSLFKVQTRVLYK